MINIEEVKNFWENNPLFTGESQYQVGSKEFFKEHKKVYYDDCLAGWGAEHLMPKLSENAKVLDLGCGVGFWTIELLNFGNFKNMYAADLTQNALQITKQRLALYGYNANLSIQNAENTSYENNFFDHINCQGVIHHTPNTDKTIEEMARILKKDGTAYISVYYKNIFLRNWKFLKPIGKIMFFFGAKLKGRGRDNIFLQDDINEITRLYDGDKNPIGKAYSKKEILNMVNQYFIVDKVFLDFFPARSLPFKIPKILHKFLSRNCGFMIFLNLRKR